MALTIGTLERPLSSRETDVLKRGALGHPIKVIASDLCITPKSVENIRGRIHDKLEVNSCTQSVVKALLLGLITLDELAAGYRHAFE